MPSSKTLELFTPFFVDLTDPRLDRGKRHSLLDIVILAVCANLGNADGWADIERFGKAKLDFFPTFLKLLNGIPSHDTFGRMFGRLAPPQAPLSLPVGLVGQRLQVGDQEVGAPTSSLQELALFLDVRGQMDQTEDLADPRPRHLPESGQLCLVADLSGLKQATVTWTDLP
jgi:hypothetical protein